MAELKTLFDYTGHLPECPTGANRSRRSTGLISGRGDPSLSSGNWRAYGAVVSGGSRLFCAAGKGRFYRGDALRHLVNGSAWPVAAKVCDNPSNPQLARFNDGGTDPRGRFYAGTFWGPGDYNGALLLRIDNDLTPKVVQCDIHGANGLAFSPGMDSGCLPLIRPTV